MSVGLVELSGIQSPDILGLIHEFTKAIQHTRDLLEETELENPFKAFGDWFVENPIGPLMDEWAAAISTKLSEWSTNIGGVFRNLWSSITDIFTGGGDGINTITGEKFAAIQLNISGKLKFMKLAFQLAWASVKLAWTVTWQSLHTFTSEKFAAIQLSLVEQDRLHEAGDYGARLGQRQADMDAAH